mmetsp:Transcript_11139/g.26787  ORF Transcript_11139/g.26787 Transcript_11139/m.26787 type:complete len:276 (-) Transcript_11139:279-1106(-)
MDETLLLGAAFLFAALSILLIDDFSNIPGFTAHHVVAAVPGVLLDVHNHAWFFSVVGRPGTMADWRLRVLWLLPRIFSCPIIWRGHLFGFSGCFICWCARGLLDLPVRVPLWELMFRDRRWRLLDGCRTRRAQGLLELLRQTSVHALQLESHRARLPLKLRQLASNAIGIPNPSWTSKGVRGFTVVRCKVDASISVCAMRVVQQLGTIPAAPILVVQIVAFAAIGSSRPPDLNLLSFQSIVVSPLNVVTLFAPLACLIAQLQGTQIALSSLIIIW